MSLSIKTYGYVAYAVQNWLACFMYAMTRMWIYNHCIICDTYTCVHVVVYRMIRSPCLLSDRVRDKGLSTPYDCVSRGHLAASLSTAGSPSQLGLPRSHHTPNEPFLMFHKCFWKCFQRAFYDAMGEGALSGVTSDVRRGGSEGSLALSPTSPETHHFPPKTIASYLPAGTKRCLNFSRFFSVRVNSVHRPDFILNHSCIEAAKINSPRIYY